MPMRMLGGGVFLFMACNGFEIVIERFMTRTLG